MNSIFRFDTTKAALLILGLTLVCIASTFPAFPVDETRYLTVAWEMRHAGNWILPTLNGEPYSHKPPLLFWLINLSWTLTGGPAVWSARLISLLVAGCVIILTGKLAQTLFPDRPSIARFAPLLLLASPMFMIYGSMIMFDFLLYASALGAMFFLWRAAMQDNTSWRPWIGFGLAVGLGVLAKGPVILLHIMGPALLAPFVWLPAASGYSKRAWYLRVLAGIGIGALVGLAWAVPAAIVGGKEFAHMIFWGQSAGRMVNAFDHRRPFFFYLPFVPVFMLPWLFTSAFWQGFKTVKAWWTMPAIRFLLCWIGPAFLAFCMVSGKQLHYIVPLLSGLAIVVAAGMDHANGGDTERKAPPAFVIPYLLGFLALAAAPYLPFIRYSHDNQVLSGGVAHFESWPFIAGMAMIAMLGLKARQFNTQILAMATATGLLLSLTTIEGARHMYKYFDLSSSGNVLQQYAGHPIAFIPKYAGEIGFAGRLVQPVMLPDAQELTQWFEAYPDGIAVIRDDNYKLWPQYKTLFSQPYKGDQRITLLQRSAP